MVTPTTSHEFERSGWYCPECAGETRHILCDGCKTLICYVCGYPCSCGGADAAVCNVCGDTGMVQCAELDGTGVYEQACPEPVHDGQPCPVCGGKGYTEAPGCNCGTPLWSLSSHEPYCGLEPCPRGCPFVAPSPPVSASTPEEG